MKDHFVIGVDFGTDSVRTVIINANQGEEISASVFQYPRWRDGLYCIPNKNQFRQHPIDYVEGIEQTIKDSLMKAGDRVRRNVRAISVDTTGSLFVVGSTLGSFPNGGQSIQGRRRLRWQFKAIAIKPSRAKR